MQQEKFEKTRLHIFPATVQKKSHLLTAAKLKWLGSPNRIVVDSDFKTVYFDRRITSIRIPMILIESTISISI